MATPAATPNQAAPQPSGGGSSAASAQKLHNVALQAEKSLEQLATLLGQAGADSATIKAVSQMADACRKIVGAIGKGQGPAQDTRPQPRNTMEAAQQLQQDVQANAAQRG